MTHLAKTKPLFFDMSYQRHILLFISSIGFLSACGTGDDSWISGCTKSGTGCGGTGSDTAASSAPNNSSAPTATVSPTVSSDLNEPISSAKQMPMPLQWYFKNSANQVNPLLIQQQPNTNLTSLTPIISTTCKGVKRNLFLQQTLPFTNAPYQLYVQLEVINQRADRVTDTKSLCELPFNIKDLTTGSIISPSNVSTCSSIDTSYNPNESHVFVQSFTPTNIAAQYQLSYTNSTTQNSNDAQYSLSTDNCAPTIIDLTLK